MVVDRLHSLSLHGLAVAMDSNPKVQEPDALHPPVPQTPASVRFSCRVVYLQATSEGPESIADHWQFEAEGPVKLVNYVTTSW